MSDPLQAFRDRNARDSRHDRNVRLAQIAFFSAALVLVIAMVAAPWFHAGAK